MALNQYTVHNSKTECFSHAQAGSFGITAPPRHKGFAITTGNTSGLATFLVPFDVLFRDSRGATFYQRVSVPVGSTLYFPVEIAGVSGNPSYQIDPTLTGLDRHHVTYFF